MRTRVFALKLAHGRIRVQSMRVDTRLRSCLAAFAPDSLELTQRLRVVGSVSLALVQKQLEKALGCVAAKSLKAAAKVKLSSLALMLAAFSSFRSCTIASH
eukprot:6188873-Pleurochrysis_carterae.AAC.4